MLDTILALILAIVVAETILWIVWISYIIYKVMDLSNDPYDAQHKMQCAQKYWKSIAWLGIVWNPTKLWDIHNAIEEGRKMK